MDVEIYGQEEHGICHVRRLSYAFAHEKDKGAAAHVAEDEEVTNTCGTLGNTNTGEGMCVEPSHLIKGKHQDRVAYRRALHRMKKTSEAA